MTNPTNPTPEFPDTPDIGPLLKSSYVDMDAAISRAIAGISTRTHHLDQDVTFILDNHQEVRLRVKKVEILYQGKRVTSMQVNCRTNFENVLILAQKINMRIAAFSNFFSVTLQAQEEFIETWNDTILDLKRPADFFETLDELKRPIYLNLNHYLFARISK